MSATEGRREWQLLDSCPLSKQLPRFPNAGWLSLLMQLLRGVQYTLYPRQSTKCMTSRARFADRRRGLASCTQLRQQLQPVGTSGCTLLVAHG
jgi:hypothetical protein